MAYALVGSAGAVSVGASGAAVTPAYGQTPTANNLLVCCVGSAGSVTLPAAPSGWSLAVQIAGNSAGASIFYKVAAGGDAAPTIAAITSTEIAARLSEYSGGATLSPLDQTGSASGAGTIVATAGAPDAAIGELLIYCGMAFWNTSSTARRLTSTLTNATATGDASNTTSGTDYNYDFGYGITTAHTVADADSMAASTGTHLSGDAVVIASFQLAAVAAAVPLGPRRMPLGC